MKVLLGVRKAYLVVSMMLLGVRKVQLCVMKVL